MPKQTPFVYRRGDVLAFRIAVPEGLRPIVGCREILRSLGTSDKRIAAPVALEFAAAAKRLFHSVRESMAGSKDEKLMALVRDTNLRLHLEGQREKHEEEIAT